MGCYIDTDSQWGKGDYWHTYNETSYHYYEALDFPGAISECGQIKYSRYNTQTTHP